MNIKAVVFVSITTVTLALLIAATATPIFELKKVEGASFTFGVSMWQACVKVKTGSSAAHASLAGRSGEAQSSDGGFELSFSSFPPLSSSGRSCLDTNKFLGTACSAMKSQIGATRAFSIMAILACAGAIAVGVLALVKPDIPVPPIAGPAAAGVGAGCAIICWALEAGLYSGKPCKEMQSSLAQTKAFNVAASLPLGVVSTILLIVAAVTNFLPMWPVEPTIPKSADL